MQIKWNEITWYSKMAALIVFAFIFLLGVICGSQLGGLDYQSDIANNSGLNIPNSLNVASANNTVGAASNSLQVSIAKKANAYVVQNKSTLDLNLCTFTMPNRTSNNINIKAGQRYILDHTDFPNSKQDKYFVSDFAQVSYLYMQCSEGGIALQAN